MKRFVSYDKISSKEKRQYNLLRRKIWADYGDCSFVTRVVRNKKKEHSKYQGLR